MRSVSKAPLSVSTFAVMGLGVGIATGYAALFRIELSARRLSAEPNVLPVLAVCMTLGPDGDGVAVLPAQALVAAHALTSREQVVAVLLAHNEPPADIASELVVSQSMVKTHIRSIYGNWASIRKRSFRLSLKALPPLPPIIACGDVSGDPKSSRRVKPAVEDAERCPRPLSQRETSLCLQVITCKYCP